MDLQYYGHGVRVTPSRRLRTSPPAWPEYCAPIRAKLSVCRETPKADLGNRFSRRGWYETLLSWVSPSMREVPAQGPAAVHEPSWMGTAPPRNGSPPRLPSLLPSESHEAAGRTLARVHHAEEPSQRRLLVMAAARRVLGRTLPATNSR